MNNNLKLDRYALDNPCLSAVKSNKTLTAYGYFQFAIFPEKLLKPGENRERGVKVTSRDNRISTCLSKN